MKRVEMVDMKVAGGYDMVLKVHHVNVAVAAAVVVIRGQAEVVYVDTVHLGPWMWRRV